MEIEEVWKNARSIENMGPEDQENLGSIGEVQRGENSTASIRERAVKPGTGGGGKSRKEWYRKGKRSLDRKRTGDLRERKNKCHNGYENFHQLIGNMVTAGAGN